MLTGSTVKEWDTMIFLKDTSSPQEYDQAIYRLQSQYVKKIKWDASSKQPDGKEEYVSRDMKPQTLLVDFDPSRMFRLQYSNAVVANAAVEGKKRDEVPARDMCSEKFDVAAVKLLLAHRADSGLALLAHFETHPRQELRILRSRPPERKNHIKTSSSISNYADNILSGAPKRNPGP